jgi:hypothetical protein
MKSSQSSEEIASAVGGFNQPKTLFSTSSATSGFLLNAVKISSCDIVAGFH